MEMDHSMGNGCVVCHVHIDLPIVEEVLSKVDAVRYIVAARPPLPALHRQQSVPGVVTPALRTQLPLGTGGSDAMDGRCRGQRIDESLFWCLCIFK